MENPRCSDNSYIAFQYFNHGYSKSCHLQSGSISGAFSIKPPKMTLTSTIFQLGQF
jgi:hypothetical protein